MLGWLYRVIVGKFKGCDHQWEVIGRTNRYSTSTGNCVGVRYALQCKHCGNIKFEQSYQGENYGN